MARDTCVTVLRVINTDDGGIRLLTRCMKGIIDDEFEIDTCPFKDLESSARGCKYYKGGPVEIRPARAQKVQQGSEEVLKPVEEPVPEKKSFKRRLRRPK